MQRQVNSSLLLSALPSRVSLGPLLINHSALGLTIVVLATSLYNKEGEEEEKEEKRRRRRRKRRREEVKEHLPNSIRLGIMILTEDW